MRLRVPSHWTRGDFAFHLTRSYLRDKTRDMGEDGGRWGGMEMKRDLLILLIIPVDEDQRSKICH